MNGTFEPDGPLREHVNGISYPTYTCAFCHSGFKADKQACHLLDCVWHVLLLRDVRELYKPDANRHPPTD
jgi:hypothetical protein